MVSNTKTPSVFHSLFLNELEYNIWCFGLFTESVICELWSKETLRLFKLIKIDIFFCLM